MAAQYSVGDTLPSRFNPSIIAASYFASLCGCLLTAELLHRRGTALRNLRSWLETIACAISMGLVGIWCMHFIGNRAIILGNGDRQVQLVYNPGYTVLSVFLPIIGLSIAFSTAEYSSRSKFWHWVGLICTGVLAGLSIVGMHYIGNFAVTNYQLRYQGRYLAASIIIAIGDCLIVLVSFYTLREEWISSWWKRVLCAVFLAGGVSAMHFTASTNCAYVLRNFNTPQAIHSRDVQVIVAGALAGGAAAILICIHVFSHYRASVLRSRSQKVMLSCAMFDPNGRILITTEGVLPSREITDKYNHRTFNEDFDTAHPVFHWVFRVTHNWWSVSELIPRMKSHLRASKDTGMEESQAASSHSSAIYDPETYSDYSIIFRERFCAASASLAAALHMPVEELGVLYDGIVETGTLGHNEKSSRKDPSTRPPSELEAALRMSVFGKGQLMFITRDLNEEETTKLLNSGYKFANVQTVGHSIAFAMQIPFSMLEDHLSRLRKYNERTLQAEKIGTWLSLFAMIPKSNRRGFDVAVQRDNQDQLPDVQVLSGAPTAWQADFIAPMDGWKVAQCVAWLEDRSKRHASRTLVQQEYANLMRNAIVTLFKQFPKAWHEWVREARFCSKQLQVHYTHPTAKSSNVTVLYAFTVIGNTHTTADSYSTITSIPISFYNIRHRCYPGSPDHAVFAHDIHQEFGPLLARRVPRQTRPQSLRARMSSLSSLAKFSTSTSHKLTIVKQALSPGRSNTLSRCSSIREDDDDDVGNDYHPHRHHKPHPPVITLHELPGDSVHLTEATSPTTTNNHLSTLPALTLHASTSTHNPPPLSTTSTSSSSDRDDPDHDPPPTNVGHRASYRSARSIATADSTGGAADECWGGILVNSETVVHSSDNKTFHSGTGGNMGLIPMANHRASASGANLNGRGADIGGPDAGVQGGDYGGGAGNPRMMMGSGGWSGAGMGFVDSTVEQNLSPRGSGIGPFGVRIACGTAQASVTFVDELIAVTKARFLPAKL